MKVWGAIVAAAVGWGSTGVATRAALDDGVPPYAMVTIRAILTAVFIFGYLRMRGISPTRERRKWKTGLVMGITNLAVPFVFFTLAYQYASAGFVGLLVALIPIGTAVGAHYLLPDEPLHLVKVIGLTVSLVGVGVLLLSGDSGLASGGRPLVAAALSMVAVVGASFAGVYAKRHVGSYSPLELTGMQFGIGAVVLLVAMLIAEGVPPTISPWGWFLILYLAVFGSIMPYTLFYWLLGEVTVTKASLIGYIVPLVALGTGALLLDERIQIGIALGGILILGGVILTDRSERTPRPILPVR
ncbi:MAG: DMT family transporter [Acidimicrobiia bacterium]